MINRFQTLVSNATCAATSRLWACSTSTPPPLTSRGLIWWGGPSALSVDKMTLNKLEFGDLAESQLTIGPIHQTPTYYPWYEILRVVRSTSR